MKFLVQVICVSEAVERREQVFEMERENLTMERPSGSASGKAKRCYGECKSSWWRSKSPLILNDDVPVRIAANGTQAKPKAASR